MALLSPSARTLSLALWLLPAIATAQPSKAPASKPDAAALAEAKRLYDRGVKLFKEGLFREALAAFVQAKEIAPRESIQRNIAQTHRELKDLPRAHDAYVELLDTFGASLKPRDAEQIRQVIDELRSLTGTVEVTSNERDAEVQVDDQRAGTTPLARPLRLSTGSHRVLVSKAGFEPFRADLEVRGGDARRIDAKLAAEVRTGKLSVKTEAPAAGAVLRLDGREVGPLPWEGDVPPGPHELEAGGPGLTTASRRVEVTRGARSEVSLRLDAVVTRLTLEASPSDARLSIDEQPVGVGAWEGPVSVGRHTVSVVREGYETYSQVLLIREGERRDLRGIVLRRLEAPAPLAPPPPDPRGVYTRLFLLGRFGTTRSQEFADDCPVTDLGGSCRSASKPLGGGAGLQIGYSFGHVGVEGFALGTYDLRRASATFSRGVSVAESPRYTGVARTEDLDTHRYGGIFGVGVRGFTRHELLRLTLGASAGLSVQQQFYRAKAVTLDQLFDQTWSSSTQTYVAPTIMLDAGLLIGSTPGAKFTLGAMMLVEFLSGRVDADASDAARNAFTEQTPGGAKIPLGTQRRLAEGTQVFFGPVLGGQFGR